ncbi:NAD(P)/FAD-dependent oxidoreductase [Croceiramulus getboli]|nr:FAD-dependent oxidoreductase [Flavobacteriaceae bacterium YJPT1-3]
MKQCDYLIVGLGLAGMAFAETLRAKGHSFRVIDNGRPGASKVAAGLYNPVILKRYTLPWKAREQWALALPFYRELAQRLQVDVVRQLPVQKLFSSIEDQNNWIYASDSPALGDFLEGQVQKSTNKRLYSPFGLGTVAGTGQINIGALLAAYEQKLQEEHAFAKANFQHEELEIHPSGLRYQDLEVKRIVFAEGFGIKHNPYFHQLPLIGNKGEYLTIHAPELQLDAAVKSRYFLIPLGNDRYKVGATFNWKDKDSIPSEGAQNELKEWLAKTIDCPYEIVDQEAGIRPTTGDRRPLLGKHPEHERLAVLNGLGTRGIMASVYLAQMLYTHLEQQEPLLEEVDIERFRSSSSSNRSS